ncbi:MAG: DEAD/DEAH box helicase family protein [Polyangiaceae bacterium]|nr:DEAD/DEAH box helicase family protein [Polyangiaceae bacterium]MCW5791304.1 DEAD/DEAH box helicase family protein [Polyangiaceae bacterium]
MPSASPTEPVLRFASGTLELAHVRDETRVLDQLMEWDPRSASYRAPAHRYAAIVLGLRELKLEVDDQARAYAVLPAGAQALRPPRPYQTAALRAWTAAQGRGVVVLPTGAGKTQVALMAMDAKRRSTLVVTPTLDLVRQWYDQVRLCFGVEVGVIGGGEHRLCDLTITTYDSAYIHMENIGARFGLVVFDECHHLPGEAYALGARLCLAPFRLGLTATPERADGRDDLLEELVGPIVFRKEIGELSGNYLADYDTMKLTVELSEADRAEYESEREVYVSFLRAQGIRMSQPSGWSDFIKRAARSSGGRRAMAAYRRQRELAFAAPAKLGRLEDLLLFHRADRTIIFTQDNATAYAIARRFLVPVITHQTKVRERSQILERFAAGEYGAVVTSKVLNEGVDVPDANVAVVVSGSGSVREHVQRLGRILRPKDGKRAVLYEIVSAGTGETFTSERRREHDAYR